MVLSCLLMLSAAMKCEIRPATLSVELRSNPASAPNRHAAMKESVYSELNWKQHLHWPAPTGSWHSQTGV